MAATTLSIAQTNNIKRTEYWDARLLEMIKLERDNFVFTTLGREVAIPLNQGVKSISFRRYLPLPVTNHKLAEGVTPTTVLQGEAIRVDASVDQFGAYMQINDWVDEIHMDDIKQIYQPELARHAAELVERNIISKIEADASVYYVGAATTLAGLIALTPSLDPTNAAYRNAYLKMQDLRKVALALKNQNRMGHTKFGGKPVVVVHPNVMADLLDDYDLKNRLLDPGQENAPIKIGSLQNYQFYGMYVQETLIAPVIDKNTKYVLSAAVGSTTGAGYTAGDLIKLADPVDNGIARGAILRVLTVSSGAIATLEVIDPGFGYSAAPTNAAVTHLYIQGTVTTAATVTATLGTSDTKIYVSFMLGKDPYVVTKLGTGAVQFKMTGFEADKSDVLGQKATFGYKLWTGAKVVDPLAIVAIYSRSAYDVGVIASPVAVTASNVNAQAWAQNADARDFTDNPLVADQ